MPVNGCSSPMFRERLARFEADHPKKKPEGRKLRVGCQGSQQLSASALDPDHPLGRAHRLGAEDGSKRFRGLPRRRLGTVAVRVRPSTVSSPSPLFRSQSRRRELGTCRGQTACVNFQIVDAVSPSAGLGQSRPAPWRAPRGSPGKCVARPSAARPLAWRERPQFPDWSRVDPRLPVAHWT